jgi:hypothetical protein
VKEQGEYTQLAILMGRLILSIKQYRFRGTLFSDKTICIALIFGGVQEIAPFNNKQNPMETHHSNVLTLSSTCSAPLKKEAPKWQGSTTVW